MTDLIKHWDWTVSAHFIWDDCPRENITFTADIQIGFTWSYSLLNLKQDWHVDNAFCQVGPLLNILREEWHLLKVSVPSLFLHDDVI